MLPELPLDADLETRISRLEALHLPAAGYVPPPTALIPYRSFREGEIILTDVPELRAAPLITRTPMIDDDGTGEYGTVVNNAWKTELYNQIDAAIAGAAAIAPTTRIVPITTDLGELPIGNDPNVFIVLDGTGGPYRIHSFGGSGVDGQRVTLWAGGSAAYRFVPESTVQVTATKRLGNIITVGDTPIIARGLVTYQYLAGYNRWYLVAHEQGGWIDVPFNAANFTTFGGSWTVAASGTVYRYRVSGKTLSIKLELANSSVSATSILYIGGLPFQATLTSRRIMGGFANFQPPGNVVGQMGVVTLNIDPGGTFYASRMDGAVFTNVASQFYLSIDTMIQIN